MPSIYVYQRKYTEPMHKNQRQVWLYGDLLNYELYWAKINLKLHFLSFLAKSTDCWHPFLPMAGNIFVLYNQYYECWWPAAVAILRIFLPYLISGGRTNGVYPPFLCTLSCSIYHGTDSGLRLTFARKSISFIMWPIILPRKLATIKVCGIRVQP